MSDLHRVSKYAESRKRNKIWRTIVTGIAAVVVFCTTYVLILPATTVGMEGLSCGLEEHTHTQECYQLTCGKQEYFSHTHNEECYEEDELICPLEERTIHHHTDACYTHAEPICGLSQGAPHAHAGECYQDGTLICALEETPGHTHTEDCYPADFQPELICGKEDLPEHRHSEECYSPICEKEEHTHTELCVDSHQEFSQNQGELADNQDEDENDWDAPPAGEGAGDVLLCENEEESRVYTRGRNISVADDSYDLENSLVSTDLPDETNPDLIMHWEAALKIPADGLSGQYSILDYTDTNGNINHKILYDSIRLNYADGTDVSGATIKMWSEKWKVTDSNAAPDTGDQPFMTVVLPAIAYDAAKMPIKLTYDTVSMDGVEGEQTFNNTAVVGGKSETASHTHTFPIHASLITTDGNDRSEMTDADSSGKLTWKVKAKVGSDWDAQKIVIKDVFPENVSLDVNESEYLKIQNPANQETILAVDETGSISKTEHDFVYSGTFTASTGALHLEIQRADHAKLSAGDEVTLTFKCKLEDAFAETQNEGTEVELTNQVTLFHDTTQYNSQPVIQTQKWRKQAALPGEEKVLKKGGSWDSIFHRETYSVKINPKAQDLLPGSDTLQIHDTLEYQRGSFMADYYLVVGSVKLYELNEDGSRKGELSPEQWSWTAADNILTDGIPSTEQWRLIKKTLNVTVPDGKALELAYIYRLEVGNPLNSALNPANEMLLKNTVSLEGVAGSEDGYVPQEEAWEASGTQGGVSASQSWTFTMVDQDNNGIVLGGAVFQAAQYVKAGESWIWQDMEGKQYTCGTDATEESFGKFTVRFDDGYDKNTLYKVYELTPPVGYVIPTDASGYMFCFQDASAAPNHLPTDSDGLEMIEKAFDLMAISGGNQLVPNKRGPQAEITVKQLWMQADGSASLTENLPESITVNLLKRRIGSAEPGTFVQEITVTGSDGWQKTVGILPVEDGMEYDVAEVPVDGFITQEPVSVGDHTFTITNVKNTTSITVQESWAGEYTQGAVPGDSVRFKLFYRLWDSAPTVEQMMNETLSREEYDSAANVVIMDGNTEFSLTLADGWQRTFSNLPISEVIDGVRKYYSYYIVEQPCSMYDISYGDARETASGILQVTNTMRSTNTLPSTGGGGTRWFTVAGLAVSMGACLGLMRKRRKGEC